MTLKNLAIAALQAPVSYFTQKKVTEYFLKDINIEIGLGEKVAFIGRNGSGKSTLCRLIAGQLFPSSGKISTLARISHFSQLEDSFFPELTGRENLEFFMSVLFPGLEPVEFKNVINECINFSGLEKKIDRPVETFSQGMVSRLALSLITAHSHEFLIMDEVHNHADEEFRKKLSERLQKTIACSKSFVIVSHYLDDLLSSCDRGIVFDAGHVIFDGSIEKAVACYRLMPKADRV